jgi:CRP/FNR family cyclic AMP-dependent transcriptional regulator
MSEKLWHLKNCGLFEQLDAEQLCRLESCSRSKSFAAKCPIYLPADRAESVFVLAHGLAKVSHLTDDGKESVLSYVEPGEMFGELAIFSVDQRDEFVESVERSTVVMFPVTELQRLMSEVSDVAIGITKLVGMRRQRVERRLKNLLFLSNRDRLIHLLLDLAEQFGTPEDDCIRLRLKLSHQELANLIGSTRETVTITLGQLKSEGMVTGGRCRIVVARPAELAATVHRDPPKTRQANPKPIPHFDSTIIKSFGVC